MEASAFFEQSSQVKREADAFLEETKLLSFLQSYGTVQLAGSYALDLMFNRDIDVVVINPAHSQDSTLSILHASIQRNCFQLHLYYNSFHFPRELKPPGYSIGIKPPFEATSGK
jgi:predicted ATP-grasp superfamily ATP-dependent carboligase